MLSWPRSDDGASMRCHKCRASYRIRSLKSLKDGAKSTCRKCGTRFGICVLPARDPGEEPPNSIVPQFAPAFAGEAETQSFTFWANGGTLFGIHLVNMLLTMVTFGIYSFWAKTRVRSYLWSEAQFANDRFAYHGTGAELFKGFLKAVGIFGIPYVALSLAADLAPAPTIQIVAQVLLALLILTFIPLAIVAVRRYRLSRTSWRGIRLSFRGSVWGFVQVFVTGGIFNILTLGAYTPFFDSQVRSYMTRNTYLGNQQFGFDGDGWGLVKHFLVAFFLTPFTLGLSWLGYMARRQRYFWEHTLVGQARFHYPITGWSLFRLKFVNLLLLVFTFGLAYTWVTVRNINFVLSHLTLEGPTSIEMILQDAQSATATGEGLESFLDTGIELG